MSQIVTRKGPVGEEKDNKRQTASPVKEMKKKIAANAEKEKQAAEKNTEKSEKSANNEKEKKSEKASEKIDKQDKVAEKTDKKDKLDKSIDKKDKSDKSVDKKDKLDKDKSVDKKDKLDKDKSSDKKEKTEKSVDKKEIEKKEHAAEKEKTLEKEVEEKKEDKNNKDKEGKAETDEKSKKPEPKAKENGAKVNGDQNGDTVSSEDELQDMEVDQEKDEMFPELAYEDSDGECFEPPTPEGVPSRSYTRRSQVKSTRTPETPRPASEKLSDKDYVPDDSKLLKLKDDVPASDRKLRSADSPKPHDRKSDSSTSDSSDKVHIPVVILNDIEAEKRVEDKETSNTEDKTEREFEVVVEVEHEDEGRVKADTNYSKSRVKVSPYRRSTRLADNTNTSLLANYTGNNTTMEMDITETSSFVSEEPYPDSPYLSGLRSIRGRRSYKPLREMTLRSIGVNRSTRSNTSGTAAEQPTRPTGTVVGRKRKPSRDGAAGAGEEVGAELAEVVRTKRARLLERLVKPFRGASTPLPARRAAEIVGINTDLPLSAPVASGDTFDPEAIKPPGATPDDSPTLLTPSTPSTPSTERDSKRCVVM